MSERFNMMMPDDMAEALKQENAKTRVPISGLVRMAIEEFLKERGYEVEATLSWGGRRDSDEAKKEGKIGADSPGPYDK